MTRDLTNSNVDRQNILNNNFALKEIEKMAEPKGVFFEGSCRLTKEMVASFFDVDIRTISRYIKKNDKELADNGYEILRGKRLKDFIQNLKATFGKDMNVPAKITVLGIFNFRAFLNLGMLLVESNNAKVLRQAILDVVIDTINYRTGGSTKYINQRDEEFLNAFLQEEDYRKQFIDALRDYVDMDKLKYPLYTDKIYHSIFREKASEYRAVLKLHEHEKERETFYSEILILIASYECGLATEIEKNAKDLNRKLNNWETDKIFSFFEGLPHWKPLLISARTKMASRDLVFRDAVHLQLQEYIRPINKDEYDRFIGEKSKELSERLIEAQSALQRLKERD